MNKTERGILIVWMFTVWIVLEISMTKIGFTPHWWIVWGLRLISACGISGLMTFANDEEE